MAGQQFINAFVEIGYNIVYWFVRRWQLKLPNPHQKGLKRVRREVICSNQQLGQYEKDYALNPAYDQFLCDEYLEMAMQFGFITLFAAVFPLAPLFALINNIFEMRLDAYKLLVTVQRPMPAQVKDIGIWMTILEIMSFLAVLCNACLIAFTSDFIPKNYYWFKTGSLKGYMDFSLSYYDARHMHFIRDEHLHGVEICRYRAFRLPPCSLTNITGISFSSCDNDLTVTYDFWVILTIRVIFVLVFLLIVVAIKAIFVYCIKDIPTKIDVQLKRERYLARQAILQRQETILSQKKTTIVNHDKFTEKIEEKMVRKIETRPKEFFVINTTV
uniref:Anoctamin n=1 Tax=Acrobeloides nanus TaxID=290746 RepID=A0A914EFL6_9BILA